MIHELNNGLLTIKISSTGAELKSILKNNDEDEIEYLWQLNPDIWERQAPLLFPIIGRLKNESYEFNGKNYKTDIHGFARFREFTVIEKGMSFISMELVPDNITLKEYPFEFRLVITYRIDGLRITKEHFIENSGEKEMLYEIGGHEGYNLALFDSERMEDYYIEFPNQEFLMTYTGDDDVMINKEQKRIELDGNRLWLSPEVFKDDALIMESFHERVVCLGNIKNSRKIVVEFKDFKYLGIWTKYMRSNYICIEPWSSLPDCNFIGEKLEEKIDIRILEPGCSEKLKYSISII